MSATGEGGAGTVQTCVQCGSAVPVDARFCPNCGLKMGLGATDEPETDAVPETVVMPPVQTGYRERREEVVPGGPAPVVMEDRPWPWGWILGILAALVALLLIALLVQEVGEGGDDPESTTTTVAPPTTTATTEQRPVLTTEPPDEPSQPAPEDPPATEPPATTAPPVTEPPVTEPPATVPQDPQP